MAVPDETLAELLLRSRRVSKEKLEAARRRQGEEGGRLADALLRLGFADEEGIALAVSKATGIPYACAKNNLLNPELDAGLESLVDERFARDNLVLPLFVEDDVLTLAMAEPENDWVKAYIGLRSGKPVRPYVATQTELRLTTERFYGRDRIQPT